MPSILIPLTLSFKCLKTAEPQIFQKKIMSDVVNRAAEVSCNDFFYSHLTGVPHSTAGLEVLTSTILPLKQRLIQQPIHSCSRGIPELLCRVKNFHLSYSRAIIVPAKFDICNNH